MIFTFPIKQRCRCSSRTERVRAAQRSLQPPVGANDAPDVGDLDRRRRPQAPCWSLGVAEPTNDGSGNGARDSGGRQSNAGKPFMDGGGPPCRFGRCRRGPPHLPDCACLVLVIARAVCFPISVQVCQPALRPEQCGMCRRRAVRDGSCARVLASFSGLCLWHRRRCRRRRSARAQASETRKLSACSGNKTTLRPGLRSMRSGATGRRARQSYIPRRPARCAAVATLTITRMLLPGEVQALHFERAPASAAPVVVHEEAAAHREVRREGRVAPVDNHAEAPTANFRPV